MWFLLYHSQNIRMPFPWLRVCIWMKGVLFTWVCVPIIKLGKFQQNQWLCVAQLFSGYREWLFKVLWHIIFILKFLCNTWCRFAIISLGKKETWLRYCNCLWKLCASSSRHSGVVCDMWFLAYLSRRLGCELLVYQWSQRPSVVRPSSDRPSTFSNIFSSKTTVPIESK